VKKKSRKEESNEDINEVGNFYLQSVGGKDINEVGNFYLQSVGGKEEY